MKINIDKVGRPSDYYITEHAKLRFKERVAKGKKVYEHQIQEWLAIALSKGYEVDKESGNKTTYRYGYYLIIMKGMRLITISYYNYNEFKYIQEELSREDTARLKKEVRDRVAYRKHLLIKANETDIKKIKSESRSEQDILWKEVVKLQEEASKVKKQIKALKDVANKYKLPLSDIIFEGDLV